MTYNKVIYIVHFYFLVILLPQFLADILINTLLFNVGHICVIIGTIGVHVWDGCWHLQVEEDCQCLVHDGWQTAITASCTKVMLQLFHLPVELFRFSWSKIEGVFL